MKVIVAILGAILITGSYGIPSKDQVRKAITRAKEMNTLKRGLDVMEQREMESVAPKCPLSQFHGRRENSGIEQERRAVDLFDAQKILLNEGFSTQDLQHESVRSEFARQLVACPSAGTCDPSSSIRKPDGSCNNIKNPTWGMAGQPQLRRIGGSQTTYDDGVGTPRKGNHLKQDLPNPRVISNAVHAGNADKPEVRSERLTLHASQMGQFFAHDILATPASGATDCCSDNADENLCFPIRVTRSNDAQFPQNYCMNFARSSATACSSSTSKSATVRQQLNTITAFIDASNVYGSSQKEMDALRDGAFMKVAEPGNRLPNNPGSKACKSDEANGVFCSLAGDFRVNVVPSLIAYHALFVREHNRIATLLRSEISDDETLFQTVRKIMIGVMQKVVYDEFLPSIMSPQAMAKYSLSSSVTYKYDNSIDATIDNVFGIAFRFGHSWITRKMSLFRRNLQPFVEMNTEDTYLDPELTYLTSPTVPGLEGLAWWLTAEASPETDGILEESARSLLFKSESEGKTDSFDLAALNIQRGRDHGVPAYNDVRKWCDLASLDTWDDVKDHSAAKNDRRLRVYTHPHDIDLFTGLVTEKPARGGSVGPTIECVLGDQFKRLKYGDRFWYQGAAAGFTAAQQVAIKQYTMAKILCNNFNYSTINAPNAFLRDQDNPLTHCDEIPTLNTDVFVPAAKDKIPGQGKPSPEADPLIEPIERLKKELEDLENSVLHV